MKNKNVYSDLIRDLDTEAVVKMVYTCSCCASVDFPTCLAPVINVTGLVFTDNSI